MHAADDEPSVVGTEFHQDHLDADTTACEASMAWPDPFSAEAYSLVQSMSKSFAEKQDQRACAKEAAAGLAEADATLHSLPFPAWGEKSLLSPCDLAAQVAKAGDAAILEPLLEAIKLEEGKRDYMYYARMAAAIALTHEAATLFINEATNGCAHSAASLASGAAAFIEHCGSALDGQTLNIQAYTTSVGLLSSPGFSDELDGTAPPLPTAPEPSQHMAELLATTMPNDLEPTGTDTHALQPSTTFNRPTRASQ